MINLYGKRIIESSLLTKKIQKKTHKWKWLNYIYLKLFGVITIPDDKVYYMQDTIIGHPTIIKILKEELENKSL
jgi:hypothetical protein